MCEITHSPAFLLAQERLAESEAENDQWQKKLTEVWAELATLRRAAERLQGYADAHPCDHMPACRT